MDANQGRAYKSEVKYIGLGVNTVCNYYLTTVVRYFWKFEVFFVG